MKATLEELIPGLVRPTALAEADRESDDPEGDQQYLEESRVLEFGLASPDGVALAVGIVRAESPGEEVLWSLVPLNVADAYGRAHRSSRLRMAASFWSRFAR